MKKLTKPMNKQTKSINNDKPRRIRVAALLNTATTLGAVIWFWWPWVSGGGSGPKLPANQGD